MKHDIDDNVSAINNRSAAISAAANNLNVDSDKSS